MKRQAVIVVLIALLVIPMGVSGAQSSVERSGKYIVVAGSEASFTVHTNNTTVTGVDVQGPISLTAKSISDTEVTVTVRADTVESRRQATIFVEYNGGDTLVNLYVIPDPREDLQQKMSKWKEEAQKWQQLKQNWIRKKIVTVETSRGILKKYVQWDPTVGPISDRTGLPKGKFVQVPIENGNPHWLASSPAGMMEYVVRQSKMRRNFRRNVLLGAAVLLLLGWSIPVIIMKHREYKELRAKMGGNLTFFEYIKP